MWMIFCRLIPETRHENYLHEQIEDPHLKPDEKTIFLSLRLEINTRHQTGQLSQRPKQVPN